MLQPFPNSVARRGYSVARWTGDQLGWNPIFLVGGNPVVWSDLVIDGRGYHSLTLYYQFNPPLNFVHFLIWYLDPGGTQTRTETTRDQVDFASVTGGGARGLDWGQYTGGGGVWKGEILGQFKLGTYTDNAALQSGNLFVRGVELISYF